MRTKGELVRVWNLSYARSQIGCRKLILRRGHDAAARSERTLSGCLDIATVAFQLHFRDVVVRHSHFCEPGRECVLIRSFHNANRFTFGKVRKAAIAFDNRIILRRLTKLTELVGRELARRNGVSAHEFCHNHFPFYSLWSVTDKTE